MRLLAPLLLSEANEGGILASARLLCLPVAAAPGCHGAVRSWCGVLVRTIVIKHISGSITTQMHSHQGFTTGLPTDGCGCRIDGNGDVFTRQVVAVGGEPHWPEQLNRTSSYQCDVVLTSFSVIPLILHYSERTWQLHRPLFCQSNICFKGPFHIFGKFTNFVQSLTGLIPLIIKACWSTWSKNLKLLWKYWAERQSDTL